MVSIVIPVYNGEKYLGRCLDSIISQTFSDIEIIVIDDGSKDMTVDILKDYSLKDSRLKFYSQKNSGVSSARNLGISKATGEYITFVDADDWIEADHIEKLYDAINKSGQMAVSGVIRDGFDEEKQSDILSRKGVYSVEESLREIIKCNGCQGYLWNKIFRNDIIQKYGIRLDKNIFNCEDLLFVVEYVLHCESVSMIEDKTYHYILSDGSIRKKCCESDVFDEKWITEIKAFDKIIYLLKEYDIKKLAIGRQAFLCNFYIKRMRACKYNNEKLQQKYLRYVRRHFISGLLYCDERLQAKVSIVLCAISPRLEEIIRNLTKR